MKFVILHHHYEPGALTPADHWDIMIERQDFLETWAIPPQRTANEAFYAACKVLPYHRKLYLDYEGGVSGNRGSVRRVDRGTYQETTPSVFLLQGQLLQGILTIDGETMSYNV